jgi:hypothetical protein
VEKDQDFAAFAKNPGTREQRVLTEVMNQSSKEKSQNAVDVV